jgi:hypothetical protein
MDEICHVHVHWIPYLFLVYNCFTTCTTYNEYEAASIYQHRCTYRKKIWLQDRRAVFSVRGSVGFCSLATKNLEKLNLLNPTSWFTR